jgi:hypothetical protein
MDPGRLSFALKIIVAFFMFDAVEKSLMIGGLLAAGYPATEGRVFVDRYFPLVLGLGFDLLLASQIGLRARAGRFWGLIYLSATTILGLFLLVVEPGRWVELGKLGRAREIATYAVNATFLAILASRHTARILTR